MADAEPRDQLTPVTVHFVDITGSTTLFAQRGDAEAYGLTKDCLDTVVALVSAGGGRVLRHVGDGVLSVFATAEEAVRAAIAISAAVEDPAGRLAREGIRIRSGISSGPAVLLADDVYGDVANVAARLVARARAGEIFFSSTVYDALPLELRGQAQAIGRMALRNRPSEVLVYKHAPDAHLATIKTDPREPLATATMEVRYGAQLLVVGEDRVRVGIGRDEDADIRIDDDAVSRRHAEIAQDHDRFVLIDHSTNGTCVYADNGAVLRVMREEIVLTGSGRILIGQKEATQPIVYRVVPVGSG